MGEYVDWDEELFEEQPTFFRITNQLGLLVPCRVCGATDRWQYCISHDGVHNYYGCLHGAVAETLPLPVIDTVPDHTDRPTRFDSHYTTSIYSVEVAHSLLDDDYEEILAEVQADGRRYEIDRED